MTRLKREVAKRLGVRPRVASYIIAHETANRLEEAIAADEYSGPERPWKYRGQAEAVTKCWSDKDWLEAMTFYQ